MKSKFWSIILRGGGVSGKFLLVFLFTKKISLEFQGEYTLVSSSVALLIILLGLDFYVYTNRIIVKQPNKLVFVFKNSLVFYLVSYLFLLPILYLMTGIELIDKNMVLILFFLTISDHLSQELFRIFIAIEKVVLANILFFLRTGAWSWPVAIYIFFKSNTKFDLLDVLLVWLIFSIISVIFGVLSIPDIKNFNKEKINKKWLFKGLKAGLFLFSGTVFLKIMEYSDRYFISYFLGNKDLGIYSFYFQFSNLLSIILFTLFISYAYPKILKNVYYKDVIELEKTKKKLVSNIVFTSVLFFFFAVFALPYLLQVVGKDDLTSNLGVMYVLILSTFVFNLSFFSHFVLIADEKDKLIVKSSLVACLINLTLSFTLLPVVGIYGAAISLLLSSVFMFLLKKYYEKRIINKW